MSEIAKSFFSFHLRTLISQKIPSWNAFRKWITKSVFVRNILIVMSGSGLAQIIGFGLTPVISRLFSPADFGVVGSFGSVANIIASGVTLEFSQAVMLPKEKADAFHLFLAACLATCLVSLVSALVCVCLPGWMSHLMSATSLWTLIFLPLATLATGLNASCQAWCVRAKAFKQTSASQVIRSVSSNCMQIGAGALKMGPNGLIASSVIADLAATLNLLAVLKSDFKELRKAINWQRLKELAKEYRDFPIYSASQNVINGLSSGLPVLLLTHYYGIVIAGAYAFGMRILNVPMGFILRSLRQVLLQKAGETQHEGRGLGSLYIKATLGLFAIIALPALALIIWAPTIFAVVFGARWHVAGEFARWLMLWMVFYFCNLPAALFARLIRIQRSVFCYELVLLAARTAALVLGGLYLTAGQTIAAFSIVGAVMNFVLIVFVGYAVMRREGKEGLGWIREQFSKASL